MPEQLEITKINFPSYDLFSSIYEIRKNRSMNISDFYKLGYSAQDVVKAGKVAGYQKISDFAYSGYNEKDLNSVPEFTSQMIQTHFIL